MPQDPLIGGETRDLYHSNHYHYSIDCVERRFGRAGSTKTVGLYRAANLSFRGQDLNLNFDKQ